jgi:hypothetical protein
VPDPSFDRLAHAGERRYPSREGVTVFIDRLGEPGVIAMAITELALEGRPAGSLGTGCELGEQDRLPGAAQASKRPVRVKRRIREERLE